MMKKTWQLVFAALLTLHQLSAQHQPVYSDLKTLLYKNGDTDPIENIQIKLVLYSYRADSSITVSSILANNHFYTDNNLYALIYHLNPLLDSLRLQPGQKVNLVQVQPDLAVNNYFKKGFRVAIITDFATKQTITTNVMEIKTLQPTKKVRESFQVDSTGKRVFYELTTSLDQLVTIANAINQGYIVFNVGVLTQLKDETYTLKQLLVKNVKSEEDFKMTSVLLTDIAIRFKQFKEIRNGGLSINRYPEGAIKVIVKDSTGNKVDNLRVYYVPKGLRQIESSIKPFPDFTSPSMRDHITVANYLIWAGKPGNSTPLTDEVIIETNQFKSKEAVNIELRLK